MEDLLYQMIYKRKSFHHFREDCGAISEPELDFIKNLFPSLRPLDAGIKTEIRVVPAEHTTCRRGAEYCILLYSEKKGNYLQNIGYIGEQIDLLLAGLNVGALWFGIGRPDQPICNGLEFIIMIAVKKAPETGFRRDLFKSSRRPLEDTLSGSEYRTALNIARFAPSACNSQPWLVESAPGRITVFRFQKPGKRGIMPADRVAFYNRVDIGIFLLFLELCLKHEGLVFRRRLLEDSGESNGREKTPAAEYIIL